eukprot:11178602-Lingulodinium_polyedra.AAC.1
MIGAARWGRARLPEFLTRLSTTRAAVGCYPRGAKRAILDVAVSIDNRKFVPALRREQLNSYCQFG